MAETRVESDPAARTAFTNHRLCILPRCLFVHNLVMNRAEDMLED